MKESEIHERFDTLTEAILGLQGRLDVLEAAARQPAPARAGQPAPARAGRTMAELQAANALDARNASDPRD